MPRTPPARLDSGHGLLAQTLRILTQSEARAEIETAVGVIERVIGAVDPAKLGKRGDPWLYFYEHFLAAYDEKLRRQFGVYYTPQEVIGGFGDVAWDDCFGGATEPLLPKRGGNYFAWPLLTDLWPWQLNGVQWKRTWPIAETREVLEARWKKLVSEPREQRSELMRETDARTVAREIEPFPNRETQTPKDDDGIHKKMLSAIASLAANALPAQPELNALLSEILAAPLFSAADFPTPTAAERAAPGDKSEEKQAAFEM